MIGGCGPYGCGDGTPAPWCCGGVPVRIYEVQVENGWVYVTYDPPRPDETREVESGDYIRKRQSGTTFILGWRLASGMFRE